MPVHQRTGDEGYFRLTETLNDGNKDIIVDWYVRKNIQNYTIMAKTSDTDYQEWLANYIIVFKNPMPTLLEKRAEEIFQSISFFELIFM